MRRMRQQRVGARIGAAVRQEQVGFSDASLRTAGAKAAASGPAVPAAHADTALDDVALEEQKAKGDPLRGKKIAIISYLVFLVVFVNASFNGRTGDSEWQPPVCAHEEPSPLSALPASYSPSSVMVAFSVGD